MFCDGPAANSFTEALSVVTGFCGRCGQGAKGQQYEGEPHCPYGGRVDRNSHEGRVRAGGTGTPTSHKTVVQILYCQLVLLDGVGR